MHQSLDYDLDINQIVLKGMVQPKMNILSLMVFNVVLDSIDFHFVNKNSYTEYYLLCSTEHNI